MGIVNVTPDSFSDGGQHSTTAAAVAHAMKLLEEGADLLDVGGESTRPGSASVTLDEELSRVVPVVAELARKTSTPLSIDTSKAEVARRCLAAGAHVVNDVTALGDANMAAVVRDSGAGVVLMHMRGTPQTMQHNPLYGDVVADVASFLQERLHTSARLGIEPARTVLDAGFGFGKSGLHNLELLARLDELQRLGRPVCLGVSRKGFLGKLAADRITASIAAACFAASRHAAQIVRVHDVAATCDALRVIDTLVKRSAP
jgi:dihydropteroate synthase